MILVFREEAQRQNNLFKVTQLTGKNKFKIMFNSKMHMFSNVYAST